MVSGYHGIALQLLGWFIGIMLQVCSRWLLSGWSHMVLWFLEMTLFFPIFYIIKVSFIPIKQMLQDES